MKLLLVDNDSDTILELRALCDLLGYSSKTAHCSKLGGIKSQDFDLIVLSGGYWYDDELKHLGQYADELKLIHETQTPIVGICLGMQLLHVADSGRVPLLASSQTGSQQISLTPEGVELLGLSPHITVHKNHTRGIIEALPHYLTLAISPLSVEIIKHRSRPLIGVQFHPEIGDIEQNIGIMRALIDATKL